MSVYDWSGSIKITFDRQITTESISSTGFAISASEPLYSPGGALAQKSYTIKRIEKSVDGLSITIYLNLSTRMRYPIGQVTVSYDGLLGNLQGQNGSIVESFSISFTPQNIVPFPNPHVLENIEISTITAAGVLAKLVYKNSQAVENIEIANIVATGTLIHIDDL